MSQVYKISENDAYQRLDRFCMKLFPRATRGLVFKLNRKSKIKVSDDGWETFRKQDNEYKLQPGDVVKFFLNSQDIETLSQKEEKKELFHGKKLSKEDIVYEDGSILIINKNPGMNVHPGDFKTQEVSLIQLVQDYLWDKLNSLTFKPSLVHRIDRDTSGIVMIAKDKNTLVNLMRDFREHKNLKKTYYAFVLWKVENETWTIDKKILRIENAKNENKVQIDDSWERAVSHYKVIWCRKLFTEKGDIDISEVLVEIDTWKMHQIRIHMADLGYPILWDNTYGDKSLNHYISREFWLSRQALHAFRIEFMNYKTMKRIKLEARLKDDMKKFLTFLK